MTHGLFRGDGPARGILPVVSLAVLLLAAAAHAGSASSGARALFFDPSIRAAGLGGSGTTLWWGGDPDDWANPALLPFHRGIRYSDMEADLVPQLSDDTRFTSGRLNLAWEEFGLVEGGKIGIAAGGRFDLGEQEATDESGNSMGTWEPWAETSSFGVGVDLVRFVHRLGWTPLDPARWSLGAGHTWKTYEDQLAPAEFLQDERGGGTSVGTRDFGLFLRWTPRNALGGSDEWLPGLGGARLDVAVGWAKQNYNGAEVSYVDSDQADPVAKVNRLSASIVFAAGDLTGPRDGTWGELFRQGLTPLVTVAAIYDDRGFATPVASEGRLDWDDWGNTYSETGYGAEICLANVFSYRVGNIDDKGDGISGTTTGWSLGLQIGAIAGFRYDEAKVPQSTYLDDVTRTGWTAYVDVIELVRAAQNPRGGDHGTH